MKRLAYLLIPMVLTACGSATEYSRECSYQYDIYDEFYSCVKDRLQSDPRPSSMNPIVPASFNTRNRAALVTYGDELNSEVRQGLITDAEAKDRFADKASELK